MQFKDERSRQDLRAVLFLADAAVLRHGLRVSLLAKAEKRLHRRLLPGPSARAVASPNRAEHREEQELPDSACPATDNRDLIYLFLSGTDSAAREA